MQLDWTPDQLEFKRALERLLKDQYPFSHRSAVARKDHGSCAASWQRLADLGVTAILVPEEHGGLGGGAAEVVLTAEQLGAALSLEPFLDTAVLAPTTIMLAGSPSQRADLLPRIAIGDMTVAWADAENGFSGAALQVATRAEQRDGAWTLTGRKYQVRHGGSADVALVTARSSGAASDPNGAHIFLVDMADPTVRRQAYRLVDDSGAADVTLAGTPATLLEGNTPFADVRDRVHAMRTAGLCGEMAGAARAALAMTIEYVKTRKQFGRALAEFQALRHRVAEMEVAVAMCEASAALAAIAASGPLTELARKDLAVAKYGSGLHGRWACEQAIQLHGGIGMTDEYAVGHYLQRAVILDHLGGDAPAQLEALVSMAEGPTQRAA